MLRKMTDNGPLSCEWRLTALLLAMVCAFVCLSMAISSVHAAGKPALTMEQERIVLQVLPRQNIQVPITLALSMPLSQTITATVVVTSSDYDPGTYQPISDTVVLTGDQRNAIFTLTVFADPQWFTGTRELVATIESVEPSGVVEVSRPKRTVVELGLRHSAFLPSVVYTPAWTRTGEAIPDLRTIAVCPGDSRIRYIGGHSRDNVSLEARIFSWKDNRWAVELGQDDAVMGSVRELVFGRNCKEVFAAVLNSGIWERGVDEKWRLVGSTEVLTSTTGLVWRDGALYAGSDFGIYKGEPSDHGYSWKLVSPDATWNITKLSISGDRIYASIWEKGVAYNDTCDRASCNWTFKQGPVGSSLIRDTLGPSKGLNWLITGSQGIGTSSVWYWAAGTNSWSKPSAPPATDNVFALLLDGETVYAGAEYGGVWWTLDKGVTWLQVLGLDATVGDMVIGKDTNGARTLYVATFDDGVWQYPLAAPPPANP